MIRISRWAAPLAVLALAGISVPVSAQYQNEYYPPKLMHQGRTSVPISGTGTVVVQVQINPNGSHKATRVIRSTNSGDNAAALDIAQNSTYHPARRGVRAISAYYDFTLRFTGKTVSTSGAETPAGMSGTAAQIDRMIRAGNYAGAKARAQAALASRGDDPTLNSELGAADYFLTDYPGAAAAFARVPSVSHEFSQVAANSYMQAAQRLATSNGQLALAYAQKAVALSPTGGAYYALGAAELSSGNAAQAAVDLKKARDIVFADPKTDVKSRVNVDAQLFQAYNKAGDTARAQATMSEIRSLDPNNPAIGTIQANTYLAQAQAALKDKNYKEAISDYEQAAKTGGPDAQVTGYTSAAFAQSAMLNDQKTPAVVADYQVMKAYADKALAVRPDDAQANFAEGVALTGEYVVGGKRSADLKSQALAALNKAKSSAQAAGQMSVSIAVDNFIKTNLSQ